MTTFLVPIIGIFFGAALSLWFQSIKRRKTRQLNRQLEMTEWMKMTPKERERCKGKQEKNFLNKRRRLLDEIRKEYKEEVRKVEKMNKRPPFLPKEYDASE